MFQTLVSQQPAFLKRLVQLSISQLKTDLLPKPERLIEVAGEIFAVRGFSGTVREICKAANCSVAAINYYFGDKQHLYFRCVQAACEEKERLFPLPNYAEATRPAERLQRFVEVMTRRILAAKNQSWQSTLLLREVLSPTPGVEEMLRAHFRPGFALLSQIIGELLGAANSHELRDQMAWQIVARCMFLRTGRHLRVMLSEIPITDQTATEQACEICNSVLSQIENLNNP